MDRQPERIPLPRVLFAILMGVCLFASLPGCQIVIGVMQIFRGFPKDDADFKKQTRRSLDEKGKKVVILASSSNPALAEHPSLDSDVIAELTRRLKAQQIDIVDSHEVTRWLDDNGGVTDETDLAEIGGKFAVDYIVLIKFSEFGFREPNSTHLFRGHARGTVVVVECQRGESGTKPSAKQIYYRPFDSKYPIHQPIPADQESPSVFKQRYLARLSEELARLFYDHRPGDEM
jgi:hypothetical protein